MEEEAWEDRWKELQASFAEVSENIRALVSADVTICNIRPVNPYGEEIVAASDRSSKNSGTRLADRPGIYGHKRPSWFTGLKVEFNKFNASKKAVKSTEQTLKQKLYFWKNIRKKFQEQEASLESLMDETDKERKERIAELLKDGNISNEEKFLKYLLLTPGMDQEYLKTLMGAAEIGISANILIGLLEEPEESFSKEMIEAYVSELRKGNAYNLKREVAEELLRGEWYIMSDIGGEPCKYQIVPMERIDHIKKLLLDLASKFDSLALGEMPDIRSSLDGWEETTVDYEEEPPGQEEIFSEDFSGEVIFDDSMAGEF